MIIRYTKEDEKEWDEFVKNNSANGTFLQTRNFLNYHKNRFTDGSMIVRNVGGDIVAVIPANLTENGTKLIAHQGSTFGGIVFKKNCNSISFFDDLFNDLKTFFEQNGIRECVLKQTSSIYQPSEMRNEILEYYLKRQGFEEELEVGYYIELKNVDEEYESRLAPLKRRKLKKAKNNALLFRKLNTEREIAEFYEVLCDNMTKFGTKPVHSLNELIELYNYRLIGIVDFYGVFLGDRLIAGSMVFKFSKKVFHTQYLASHQSYLGYCPNEYLYVELVKEAKKGGYKNLSFGTSTLDHGRVLNRGLALFKEGFDTDTYVNKTYTWKKGEINQ